MPTVIIHWAPGRSQDQKNRIFKRITDALVEDGGAAPETVTIIMQDITPGDAARSGEVIAPPKLENIQG
jgi:4-oxalocrotonate tautomerase